MILLHKDPTWSLKSTQCVAETIAERGRRAIDQQPEVKDLMPGDTWSAIRNQNFRSCICLAGTEAWQVILKENLWLIGFHPHSGILSIFDQTKLSSVQSSLDHVCLSATLSGTESTAKSTRSRPSTSHLNIVSCALRVLSSMLTLWGSSLVGITDNVYSPWTHIPRGICVLHLEVLCLKAH